MNQKNVTVPKLMYIFNTTPFRIPVGKPVETWQVNSKIHMEMEDPDRLAKIVLKKNKIRGLSTSSLEVFLQSYINQGKYGIVWR